MLAEVQGFVDGDDLVAHNAPFDRSVYQRACECCLLDAGSPQWWCTLSAARRHLTLPNYRLPTVTRALGLDDFQHHHAGSDAEQAALVALGLAQIAGVRELAELWRR